MKLRFTSPWGACKGYLALSHWQSQRVRRPTQGDCSPVLPIEIAGDRGCPGGSPVWRRRGGPGAGIRKCFGVALAGQNDCAAGEGAVAAAGAVGLAGGVDLAGAPCGRPGPRARSGDALVLRASSTRRRRCCRLVARPCAKPDRHLWPWFVGGQLVRPRVGCADPGPAGAVASASCHFVVQGRRADIGGSHPWG